MSKSEIIRLSILGKEDKQPIRLDELGTILRAYQQMLDRSYLVCRGDTKIKRVKRDNFRAVVHSMENGSAIFDIITHTLEQAAFGFGAQGPEAINQVSELMRKIVYFFTERERLRKMNKKTPEVQVSNEGTGNVGIGQVIVNGNNNKIVIPPIIKTGSDMSEDPVRQMTSVIKRGNVREISSVATKQREQLFSLNAAHAHMMHDVDEYDDQHEKLVAKIHKFDTFSGKGRLRVIESVSMSESAEHSFIAINHLYDDIVNAMHVAVSQSRLVITKDYNRHPNGELTVNCLHVRDIENE